MAALPSFVYLALALAALAAAGGLLVWVIRYTASRDGEGSEEPSKPRVAVESAPAVAEPAPASVEPAPGTYSSTDNHELLRVTRTEEGRLAVFVQGQCYSRLQEIRDPRVGSETVEALKTVLAFAEGWLPLKRPTPEPAVPQSSVDEEAFLERLRRSNLFPSDTTPRPSISGPPIPAEVINNLVQERLRQRPDLAQQRIYLATEADGSLRIHVGIQSFETVDEITNPEVRMLIQDAIHEFESA